MEKEFFDVFPSLKLKDQLKEWLEMVTVSRVTCNEVFANELCGIAPRCKTEPVNLAVAILVCLAAVNSHAKARDRNAALCGPKFRISSKPTLKIAAIQH